MKDGLQETNILDHQISKEVPEYHVLTTRLQEILNQLEWLNPLQIHQQESRSVQIAFMSQQDKIQNENN